MPRHSPTRRNRRIGKWTPQDPSGRDQEPETNLLTEEGTPDVKAGREYGDDPNWKPAKRTSRYPNWIPRWLQHVIRLGFRCGGIAFLLLFLISLSYFILSLRYNIEEIREMPERSVIFDMQGRELATLHGENRRLIAREEIPDFFVKAVSYTHLTLPTKA